MCILWLLILWVLLIFFSNFLGFPLVLSFLPHVLCSPDRSVFFVVPYLSFASAAILCFYAFRTFSVFFLVFYTSTNSSVFLCLFDLPSLLHSSFDLPHSRSSLFGLFFFLHTVSFPYCSICLSFIVSDSLTLKYSVSAKNSFPS